MQQEIYSKLVTLVSHFTHKIAILICADLINLYTADHICMYHSILENFTKFASPEPKFQQCCCFVAKVLDMLP